MVQEAATAACQQLGFTGGALTGMASVPPAVAMSPPWLGSLDCGGGESLGDCAAPAFGDVGACGLTQRLVCSTSSGAPAHPGYPAATNHQCNPPAPCMPFSRQILLNSTITRPATTAA